MTKIEENLTFEQASKELDEIIEKLENQDLPLDEIVKSYERASVLIEICNKTFDKVQGKITIIQQINSTNLLK